MEAVLKSDNESELEGLSEALLKDLLVLQPFFRIGRHFKGIVHNLNGYLQNALLQVELLHLALQSSQNPPEIDDMGRRLKRLSEELDGLAADLRFWGQHVDFESVGRDVPVDLNYVLREALAFLKADLFFKHQVSTELRLQPDLPTVCGNLMVFYHAFGTLFDQAMEAMRTSDHPCLLVETRGGDGRIEVIIQHNGSPSLAATPAPTIPTMPPEGRDCSNWRVAGPSLPLALHLASVGLEPYCGRITREEEGQKGRFIVHLPIPKRTSSHSKSR
jgi:signal transduction histidine kinase